MNLSRIATAATLLTSTVAFAVLAGRAASASPAPAAPSSAVAHGSGSSSFVPGRLLVRFRASTTAAEQTTVVRGVGATNGGSIRDLGIRILNVPAGTEQHAADALLRTGKVSFAERDGTASTTDITPNDPYYPTGQHALSGGEWGDAKTQAPAAWGITTGSANVTVAVLDSGVASTQPDLSSVLVPGWNVLTGTTDTSDTYGHGTSVAGVAVATSNNTQGVAAYCWQCSLMPVKVSTGSTANYSDIAKGITWAVDHGADVLNISIAGTTASSTLTSAVSYATSHGVVVVAAAGNNSSSAPMYPAAIPDVISVAATDQFDALTSYSEYGSWVDVAAPGSTVSTLYDGGYNAVGGTSIASPAVAGIAALLLSVAPTMTPSDIASALTKTVDPMSGTKTIASGRVNAYRALLTVGGSSPPPPPPPPAPPALVTAPSISGAAQTGQTLTTGTGSWSGSPTSYAYKWQRCDGAGANCTDVPGAATSTYSPASSDVGYSMRAVVTATNSGGSASASSAPTAVVTAGSTTNTFSGSLTKNSGSRSYSWTVGSGPTTARLSFAKCSSLSLSVATPSGSVVAAANGASVLSLATNLSAGNYIWTVSGSCRVSYTLNVTAAA
jgi:thermitase